MARLALALLAAWALAGGTDVAVAEDSDEEVERQNLERLENSTDDRATAILTLLDTDGDRRVSEDEIVAFFVDGEGAAAFSESLAVCRPQVGSAPGDWQKFLKRRAKVAAIRLGGVVGYEDGYLINKALPRLVDTKLSVPGCDGSGRVTLGFTLSKFLPGAPAKSDSSKNFWQKSITVRESFLDAEGIGKPALLNLTRFGGSDETREDVSKSTVFAVKGALTFRPALSSLTRGTTNPNARHLIGFQPLLVYEPNISSDAKPGADTITHRVGIRTVVLQQPFVPDRWGHVTDITLDYISDHRYDASRLGLTFQYTPNVPIVAVGLYRQLAKDVYVRWRPYLVFNYQDIRDTAGNEDLAKLTDFFNMQLRGQIEFLVLSHLRFTFAGAYTQELLGSRIAYGSFGASGRYSFDDNDRFSLVASYDYGKDEPPFKRTNQLSLAVGFKY